MTLQVLLSSKLLSSLSKVGCTLLSEASIADICQKCQGLRHLNLQGTLYDTLVVTYSEPPYSGTHLGDGSISHRNIVS